MADWESILAKIEKLTVSLFSNNHLKIDIHNGPQIDKVLVICREDLEDPERRKKLEQYGEIISEYIASGGQYLLPSVKSTKEIEEVGKIYENSNFADLLQFVKENLPAKDEPIWIAALVLKTHYDQGRMERVWQIKGDIVKLHGIRGANIANLCSGNYLESEIIPLYQQLVVELKNREKFLEEYESIINDYIFAVFVKEDQSVEEVAKEIKLKIEQLLASHQSWVDVHGIGIKNVKTVKAAIEIISEQYSEQIDDIQTESSNKFIKSKIVLETSKNLQPSSSSPLRN